MCDGISVLILIVVFAYSFVIMIDIRGGRLDWEGSKALADSLSRI